MTDMIPALTSQPAEQLLCYYINHTSRIQVVKITNLPSAYFERIVFPGQRLLFEADADAVLEVYSSATPTAVLADQIPCQRLQVVEKESSPHALDAASKEMVIIQ